MKEKAGIVDHMEGKVRMKLGTSPLKMCTN